MAAMSMFNANDELVEIIPTSSPRRTCFVHRSLLMEASDHLRLAVNTFVPESINLFTESFGPVVIKTEVPSNVLQCFVQWLYTGQLTAFPEQRIRVEEILEIFEWTKRELKNTALRDHLVDRAIDLITVNPQTLYATFDHLDNIDGGMLMFLTDFLVHSKFHNCANSDIISAELSVRLASCVNADAIYKGLAQSLLSLGETPPWIENRCQYHEHVAIACCVQAPGVQVAAEEGGAVGGLMTPPPAPRKKRVRRLDPDQIPAKTPLRGGVKKKNRNTTTTVDPSLFPATPMATPKKQPAWSPLEKIHFLQIYRTDPDASFGQMTALHNASFWPDGSVRRTFQGVSALFDRLFGETEDIPAAMPEKIVELQGEMEMS